MRWGDRATLTRAHVTVPCKSSPGRGALKRSAVPVRPRSRFRHVRSCCDINNITTQGIVLFFSANL